MIEWITWYAGTWPSVHTSFTAENPRRQAEIAF